MKSKYQIKVILALYKLQLDKSKGHLIYQRKILRNSFTPDHDMVLHNVLSDIKKSVLQCPKMLESTRRNGILHKYTGWYTLTLLAQSLFVITPF